MLMSVFELLYTKLDRIKCSFLC